MCLNLEFLFFSLSSFFYLFFYLLCSCCIKRKKGFWVVRVGGPLNSVSYSAQCGECYGWLSSTKYFLYIFCLLFLHAFWPTPVRAIGKVDVVCCVAGKWCCWSVAVSGAAGTWSGALTWTPFWECQRCMMGSSSSKWNRWEMLWCAFVVVFLGRRGGVVHCRVLNLCIHFLWTWGCFHSWNRPVPPFPYITLGCIAVFLSAGGGGRAIEYKYVHTSSRLENLGTVQKGLCHHLLTLPLAALLISFPLGGRAIEYKSLHTHALDFTILLQLKRAWATVCLHYL